MGHGVITSRCLDRMSPDLGILFKNEIKAHTDAKQRGDYIQSQAMALIGKKCAVKRGSGQCGWELSGLKDGGLVLRDILWAVLC